MDVPPNYSKNTHPSEEMEVDETRMIIEAQGDDYFHEIPPSYHSLEATGMMSDRLFDEKESGGPLRNLPTISEVYSRSESQVPTLSTLSSQYSFQNTREILTLRGGGYETSQQLDQISMSCAPPSHTVVPVSMITQVTNGFHDAPRFYGDPKVRGMTKITGIKSGLKAAGSELGLGFYDGFTGLVTQPMEGAVQAGGVGLAKGLFWGSMGVLVKPVTAVTGLIGCTAQGIHKEVQKRSIKEEARRGAADADAECFVNPEVSDMDGDEKFDTSVANGFRGKVDEDLHLHDDSWDAKDSSSTRDQKLS